MPVPLIVILSIVGVGLMTPLVMLFVSWLGTLAHDLFPSTKNKKDSLSFDKCLQQLNSCTEIIHKREIEYVSSANEFVEKRLPTVSYWIGQTVIAFNNEFGLSDSLTTIQEDFTNLSSSIKEGWTRLTSNGLYISDEQFNKVFEINNKINDFITKAVTLFSDAKFNIRKASPAVSNNNRRIFIVHGRNHAVRDDVKQLLIENKFEPIILENEPNKGQFLLQKFLSAASTVSYAIVIMTGDDKVDDVNQQVSRARQNVILELGYFISQIGKERIIILQDSNIENPSDIAGLVYETIDTNGDWKGRVLKELYAVGYVNEVNINE